MVVNIRCNALRLLHPTGWEHLIRDEADFRAHMDYVHINPVKHGLVKRVADWPHSTFHRLVQAGTYPADWAGGCEKDAISPTD